MLVFARLGLETNLLDEVAAPVARPSRASQRHTTPAHTMTAQTTIDLPLGGAVFDGFITRRRLQLTPNVVIGLPKRLDLINVTRHHPADARYKRVDCTVRRQAGLDAPQQATGCSVHQRRADCVCPAGVSEPEPL